MENQKRLAREWAEYYQNDFPKFTEGSRAAEIVKKAKAAAEYILAHTDPPTMEGVQWDAREHRGLGTFGEDGVEWVMVDMRPDRRIVGVSPDFRKVRGLRPEWLTPNGKRYEMVEVGAEQAKHPKTLRTVEDYENAPDGTIVAKPGYNAFTKRCGEWVGMHIIRTDSIMAENGPWEVLRRGWGE